MQSRCDDASEARSAVDCGSLLPLFSVRQRALRPRAQGRVAAGDELLLGSHERERCRIPSGASRLAPYSGSRLPQSTVLRTVLLMAVSMMLGCGGKKETTVQGHTMGTTWKAVVVLDGKTEAPQVSTLLQSRLDELEAIFSNWRADTPVARFNVSTTTEWQPVPRELAEVATFAQRLSKETHGAFDVTVSELIDLWGFGKRGPTHQPPSDTAIAEAKRQCGWEKLAVKSDPPMLRKSQPDLRINLSALVEGYAVDDLVKRLHDKGLNNFLLEVGGEIYASGVKADGSEWQVGVQRPDAEKGVVMGAMPLRDRALATSGTYQQFFEHAGKRYPHILDARTGRPVEHATTSVSVTAPSCFTADGWATALLILGPQEGTALAEKDGVSAMFLTQPPAVR